MKKGGHGKWPYGGVLSKGTYTALEEPPPNDFTVRGQTKGKPSQNGSRVKNEVMVTWSSREV